MSDLVASSNGGASDPATAVPGSDAGPEALIGAVPKAVAGDPFERMLWLLGRLNYVWTNTESLLIHLIAGLARTDKESATVIFLTLGSSTARLSLVRRLAKLERVDAACRNEVLALAHDFDAVLKVRNRYNHCIYSFDEGRPSTILMRVQDRPDAIRMGKKEGLDAGSLRRVEEALARLGRANRAIWSLVARYDFPA